MSPRGHSIGMLLLLVMAGAFGAATAAAEPLLGLPGAVSALGLVACMGPEVADCLGRYSHSIVPGGLDVMSRTTRLTSRISLSMREAIRSSRS